MAEKELSRTQERSKDQHIESILEAVIQLEITKGHLRWRMSDVSRSSGVTRSLLYYYFGSDKKKIFLTAVDYYVEEFFAFKIDRAEKIKKGQVVELIRVARRRLRKSPYFLQFYAKQRLENTEVSPYFEKAEKKYFESLKESLPPRWRPFSRTMWALIFGLAVQPGVTEDDLCAAERILRRAWPQKN